MGRISLEIVPRCENSFASELKTVKEKFERIDTLNIPDILKFEMRIPEACRVASGYFSRIIPHIRAVSVNSAEPLAGSSIFGNSGQCNQHHNDVGAGIFSFETFLEYYSYTWFFLQR